jgi:hypothetical protein
MNICPRCNEEFLDHVSMCTTCNEKLIKEHVKVQIQSLSKDELLQQETMVLSEGSLDHCREFEKILQEANIPALVYPAHLDCNDNAATLGATCSTKYLVLISPTSIERSQQALESHFHAHLSREGQGAFVRDIVDIGQSEIICPACGEEGALKEGECSFCGLFLGEPH